MKSILILVPLFAGLGLAQPPPTYSSSNVYPQPQPQTFNNITRGPQYIAAPLIIDCYCSGSYWYWAGVRVGWKKQIYGYDTQPHPTDKIAVLTIGTTGVCNENVSVFRESYLSIPRFDVGFSPPIPIPGVGTEVEADWAFQGFPYTVRDQWHVACDPDETLIETRYIAGPFPC